MTISNTDRITPSGLSVFGWYTRTDQDGLVSVHVDVGFSTGKFGGSVSDKIEFELSLKRAQVVVICGGGARPKLSTIAREKIETRKVTETSESTALAEAALSLNADIGAIPKASLDTSANLEGKVESAMKQEAQKIVTDFFVQHQKTSDGHPAWEVSPRAGDYLIGNPWDAVEQPRLRVEMPESHSKLEPTIRVEIRCRGEDLWFGDSVRLKDSEKQSLFSKIKNNQKNLAAAEQLLKKVLEREGLPLASPSEKFGEITLADVILTVE